MGGRLVLALFASASGSAEPDPKMLKMGAIMRCSYCQLLVRNAPKDVSAMRRFCGSSAAQMAEVSKAPQAEAESFCLRVASEYGEELSAAAELQEDLASFCVEDGICPRLGKDKELDGLVEGILGAFADRCPEK
ncbi:unnamed protein product [Effrenium voratum]|nr:unnamed protein product [Effrenium voratum]